MKASNIFQKLKSAGFNTSDGEKPLIEGVGIKSPLNMKSKSPVKKAVPDDQFDNEDKNSNDFTDMVDTRLRVQDANPSMSVDKVKKVASNIDKLGAIAGKIAGKQTKKSTIENKKSTKKDPYADALKKDSKLGDYVKTRNSSKKGSKEYVEAQNKINAAYGVKKRHTVKQENNSSNQENNSSNKENNSEDAVKPSKTDVAKENLQKEKDNVKTVKSEVKDTNKAKRIQKRADKKAKKAKRIKEEGGTRVGNALRGIFKKKDKKKKDDVNVDSPAKLKKPSKGMKVGKKVKVGKGEVSKKRAARLIKKGKADMSYKIGGIGPDNQPGGKNNKGQLMIKRKNSIKIKKIKK